MPGPSLFIRQQCPLATPANDGLMSAAQAAAVTTVGESLFWSVDMDWSDYFAIAQKIGSGVMMWQGSADGSPRLITPPGNYPLTNFQIIGVLGAALPAEQGATPAIFVAADAGVTFDDQDATLTTLAMGNVALEANATLAAPGTTLYARLDGSVLFRTGNFTVFPDVTAATVVMTSASSLSNDGSTYTAPLIEMAANGFTEAFMFNGSFIDVATFGGDSSTGVAIEADESSYELASNPANVTGAASLSVVVFGSSSVVGAVDYDIANGGKIHGPLPFSYIALSLPVVAQGTVAANTFVKNGTADGTFTTLLKTDNPLLRVGICTVGGTNGTQISVLFLHGVRTTILHDAASPIVIGAFAYYSLSVDGAVTATSNSGPVAGIFQSTAIGSTVEILS